MKNLWWMIKEIIPFWPRLCLALLLSALTISSHIGLMATSSYLLARAALRPPIMDLMIVIVGVRFFGLSRAVFRYFERLVSHDVTFRVLSRIRVSVYNGVEPLAPAHLKDFRSGDLLSRIVGDVEVQQNLLLRVVVPPLVAFLVLLGYGGFLARFDQGFTYILAGFFLVAGVVLPYFVRMLSRGIGQMKVQAKAKMQTFILDSLQGMPEMLAFGQRAAIYQRIQAAQKDLSESDRKMARVTGISNALMGLAANLGMLTVLALGIILVEKGQLDGVLLGMLALGVLSSFEAVAPLTVSQHYLEETQVAAKRLKDLIEKGQKVSEETNSEINSSSSDDEDPDNNKNEIFAKPLSPVIEFKNVCFRYEQEEPWALEDISFEVPKGKRIGIVGPSGAGKSSLVNLLLGFWKQQSGEIRFGGKDVNELTPEFVREQVAVVTQKTYLFHATVRENLLLAKPEATDEELFEVTRKAKIHDFILTLPQGYDSLIGDEGMKLSGGQQQRLALARVLLKQAPILIFDEATNGLDPIMEQELRKELFTLMEGHTFIVITHHLDFIKDMDEILVLDKGRVVECGTHDQLLEKKGKYWNRVIKLF